MIIRRAMAADAPGIHTVHHAAIRGICASVYSPDQIDAWTSVISTDSYVSGMELFDFLVAEHEGSILGFSVVNVPGAELNTLYVAPSAGGQGVGSALLKEAEDLAFAAGVQRITLKATLNAVTFYERAGYSQLGPALHPLPTGQQLPCIRMAKLLSWANGAA